ncbi:MAG: beta-mannosidase [Butyrivibrio sp.]|nr:beta-mannosidase [Butyrivibrio sp.]
MKRWKKTAVYLMALTLSGSQLAGCGGEARQGSGEGAPEEAEEAFVPEVIATLEAEEASFAGNVHGGTGKPECSGGGYATGFQNDGDACVFNVEIQEDGFYDLWFCSAASDYKENYVTVDGEAVGNLATDSKAFAESGISRVYLAAGAHEVSVSKFWGWIDLDYMKITTSEPIPASTYQVSAELVNENATDNAKRLMSYLADNYGSKILSGQYCDTGINGKEFQVVKKVTGKTPAVLGLDFMEYTPSFVEHGSTGHSTDLAMQCWEQGGIVTFCWHWNAPTKYLTGNWYSGFYAEYTNLDLAKVMNGQDTEGYDLLMQDIDAIAQQLLILQEAGVPVLWRPLHEASGGWFWWGAAGPEPYIQLYRLLYDKLTNEYKLNNLIWVWNGQNKDWYPGDEYVDIIGEDIYPGERVYTSQVNKYLEAVNYTEAGKMVVLSENGCVFDPDLAVRDGAMWGFWCTWSGEFVAKDTSIYAYSEQYTEAEALKRFYEAEAVITLDELPDLKEYPIRK